MKKTIIASLLIVGILTVAAVAQRETPITETPTEIKPVVSEPGKLSVSKKKIRENTPFKGLRGSFRATGTRTTFFSADGSDRFLCLENLNLERILKAIEENPTRSAWKIDGVYTEFRGENYLLIQRAVVAPGETTPAL